MKRVAQVVMMLALAGAKQLQATAIEIDLGPPLIYTGINAKVGPIPFSDLNGLSVNGSALSLDFSFSNNEFVRLFSNTSPSFEVGITLFTNAGTFPSVVTNASAYLVDQNGNALPGGVVGTSDGSNGTMSAGFFPLLGPPSLPLPFDFYGVHFGFTLPNDPSVMVIGAEFVLFGNGDRNSKFELGPNVPDGGDTWLLLLVGASGTLALKGRSIRKNARA
jgi:hypothetical protein